MTRTTRARRSLRALVVTVAALGIVAALIQSFPGYISLAVDALAAVFFLAGGIALALAMKGISCTDDSAAAGRDRFHNKILNGGCDDDGCFAGGNGNDALDQVTQDSLKGRCTRAQADFAFEFIAFVFCLGSLVMTFLSRRNQGKAVYA